MIQELRETIYDTLNSVSGLSNVFYKRAPEGTTYPYVVFSEVVANYGRLDTNDKIETIPVQVDVFGAKYSEATHEAMVELIKAALDTESNYTLTSYTIMDVLRDFSIPVNQDDVLQTSLQYTFNLIEV